MIGEKETVDLVDQRDNVSMWTNHVLVQRYVAIARYNHQLIIVVTVRPRR